jgi:putative membrane protein insertion efficiency factor
VTGAETTRRLSAASRLALRFVATYQDSVSPGLRARCQFEPSCSEYSRQAYQRYGFLSATRRTLGRLRRCRHGAAGGIDNP